MNKEELHRMLHPIKLIGLGGNQTLAEKVAAILQQPLLETAVHHFSDGEIQVQVSESVRGCDVFVIQSIQDPVNENFMELMITLDALTRASAHKIIPVIPYMAYSRSDTKTRSREPITAKLVANLIQLNAIDSIIALDLHASQIQGFYNVPVDHLHALPILAQYFLDSGIAHKSSDDVVVVSPDHAGYQIGTNDGSIFRCSNCNCRPTWRTLR
jgi:ribose-phosphate pyrophosphokinase